MVVGNMQMVKACGICSVVGHPTDMCPTLQEEPIEQVNAVGGFLGQPQRKYDPYLSIYNPRYAGTTDYYLKTRDTRVRQIACLPDSNRNLTGEFVRVSGNWLADELPCPFSPCGVGRYQEPSFVLSLNLLLSCLHVNLTGLFVDLLQKEKGFN